MYQVGFQIDVAVQIIGRVPINILTTHLSETCRHSSCAEAYEAKTSNYSIKVVLSIK